MNAILSVDRSGGNFSRLIGGILISLLVFVVVVGALAIAPTQQSSMQVQTETMDPATLTVAMNSAMAAGDPIPQLGPQDLKDGLPSGPISIIWGGLTWFSWCQSDNPQGPIWHIGWRKGEIFDGMTLKIPNCSSWPALSKKNVISLIRSFKDRVPTTNLSVAEIAEIKEEIEAFAQLLEKFLAWF